jgi:hypothetical protein
MISRLIITGVLNIAALLCFAQSDPKKEAMDQLKNLSEKYKNSAYLSFDLSYKYSNNDKPETYLDSLKGSFKLNGAEYIYDLDNTEMISTKEYSITLFKEDKIMYLKKASQNVADANPIAMLDSFFLQNQKMECSVTDSGDEKKISLKFQPGLSYNKMEYYIDRKTGYIKKAVCMVDSRQMYDPIVRNKANPTAKESIIEISFNHYKNGLFGKEAFDAARYFKKEGDEYVTVPPYDSYKIFLGTPNL